MAVVIKRFEVRLIALDPTIGAEIKKTRPCLVIFPSGAQGAGYARSSVLVLSEMPVVFRRAQGHGYATLTGC
jgi:mRNA-degrading endonuclease toxin of MazEF toxin-antitoxin module